MASFTDSNEALLGRPAWRSFDYWRATIWRRTGVRPYTMLDFIKRETALSGGDH
jgi:hypothetical protein